MEVSLLRSDPRWEGFHNPPYATEACRRNIEMTPLRKAQMALSRMLGLREDGPDGGGVDERQGVRAARRSPEPGGRPHQDRGRLYPARATATAGVPLAARLSRARRGELGVEPTRPAQQQPAARGGARAGDRDRQGALRRLRPDAGLREAQPTARLPGLARDLAQVDDRRRLVARPASAAALGASAAQPTRSGRRAGPDRRLAALLVREPRAGMHADRLC